MSERLDEIFDVNGAYIHQRAVDVAATDPYRGRVPDLLIELWQEKGLGSWKKGLLRLCHPTDFQGLLALVFKADEDFSHKDCHIFATTAFGEIYFWSERHWVGTIDLAHGEVVCVGLTEPETKHNQDVALGLTLFDPDKDALDEYDSENKPLYTRLVKALGALEPEECFGFVPALALGGSPEPENVKRLSAMEHFSIIAQMQPFRLVDYLSAPMKVVREIG